MLFPDSLKCLTDRNSFFIMSIPMQVQGFGNINALVHTLIVCHKAPENAVTSGILEYFL